MADETLRDLVREILATLPPPGPAVRQATVQAVGTTTVDIRIGASTTTITGVKYLAAYSPKVADVVWVLQNGADLIVLDRLSDNTYRLGKAGSSIGQYGITAVTRPAAYTQTYSSASRSHATPTATDPGAATIDDPADSPATVDALRDDLVANTIADIRTALAALRTQINNLIADQANTKQVLNSVIDDHQIRGDFQ